MASTSTALHKPPTLVVHADWGKDPKKRWMASAALDANGYLVHAPELVGDLATFFDRLLASVGPNGCVLVGFDFPIGLPMAYATRAGINDFVTALAGFGTGPWIDFFAPACSRAEIGIYRPFYPHKPGGTSREHLLSALGISVYEDLLRECERGQAGRSEACALFWTLGAKQVGKGAITGWRDLIAPALRGGKVKLAVWPFHGKLPALLMTQRLVVAETYPAEAYRHLSFPRGGWSKRNQSGRKARAVEILNWASNRAIAMEASAKAAIVDGFGPSKDGEDPFDATVGLCSMLEVVQGHRPAGCPSSKDVAQVEGWILGQA
jgi:hypothetical protein